MSSLWAAGGEWRCGGNLVTYASATAVRDLLPARRMHSINGGGSQHWVHRESSYQCQAGALAGAILQQHQAVRHLSSPGQDVCDEGGCCGARHRHGGPHCARGAGQAGLSASPAPLDGRAPRLLHSGSVCHFGPRHTYSPYMSSTNGVACAPNPRTNTCSSTPKQTRT